MKKIRKFLSIFFIVCFCLQTLIGCSSNKDNGYYNGIKWEESFDNVKSKLSEKTIESDKNRLTEIINNPYGIENSQIWITYEFYNDKLSKIYSTPIIPTNNSKVSNEELNQMLLDKFIKKYGDYNKKNDVEYEWNTKYSNITLSLGSFKYVPIE